MVKFINPISVGPEYIPVLVKRWAPLVWLAKGETWNPSSVDFFLQAVSLRVDNSNVMFRDHVDVVNFPTCSGSCYLDTKMKLSHPSATNVPVFKGQGSNSPTYAIIRKEGKSGDFSVKYWFFFPYNRGTLACDGLVLFGLCVGRKAVYDNSVGNWEHLHVRFRNYNVHSIYMNSRNVGMGGWQKWNGKKFVGKYIKHNISMMDGHPMVYSAKGTHTIWCCKGSQAWSMQSKTSYLFDHCSEGTKWETWKNLRVVDHKEKGQFRGQFTFMNFKGRWGNNKNDCNSSGRCVLENGPSGPPK